MLPSTICSLGENVFAREAYRCSLFVRQLALSIFKAAVSDCDHAATDQIEVLKMPCSRLESTVRRINCTGSKSNRSNSGLEAGFSKEKNYVEDRSQLPSIKQVNWNLRILMHDIRN